MSDLNRTSSIAAAPPPTASASQAQGTGGPSARSAQQAQLQHWIAVRPDAPALLHKRNGHWHAWRWRDVPPLMDAWAALGAQHGLGPGATLAVSGALEPDLIALTLAAWRLGARVAEVDPALQSDALAARLQAAAPTHAFVQARRAVADWQRCAPAAGTGWLLLPQVPGASASDGPWQTAAIDRSAIEYAAPGVIARLPGLQAALLGQDTLWVEEGTQWRGGLELALQEWLGSGAVLAAPESEDCAARDRRELAPRRVLASSERRQRWQADLKARWPVAGSWQHALLERWVQRPDGLAGRWLRQRLGRLEGLPAQDLPPLAVPAPRGIGSTAGEEALA